MHNAHHEDSLAPDNHRHGNQTEVPQEILENEIDPALPRAFGLFYDDAEEQRVVHTQKIGSLEDILAKQEQDEHESEAFGSARQIVDIFKSARTETDLPSGKKLSRRPHLVITGGFVRDILLEKTPKDIDFATNLTYEEVEKLLSDAWKTELEEKKITLKRTGALFPIMRVHLASGEEYEIATFRTESGTTDGRRPEHMETVRQAGKDADRRDLTINALFYNPLSGNVIDYVDGLKDIREKKLRFVGDPAERISEDNTRMLRYLRFLQKTGFEEDPAAKQAIQEAAENIKLRPGESIVSEVERTFGEGNVGTYLERLHEYGLLQHLLPEVSKLEDCEQGPPYHMEGNALKHTVLVANGLPKNTSVELCWAAILHDIGKHATRSEETDEDGHRKVHFYGHENISTSDAQTILTTNRFPAMSPERRKGRQKIFDIVAHHIEIFEFHKLGQGKAERFLDETAEYWDELYALAVADIRASYGESPAIDEEHERDITAVARRRKQILDERAEAQSPIAKIFKVINGDLIKERYIALYGTKLDDKKHGKLVGSVKKRAHELIQEQYAVEERAARDILDTVIQENPPN